MTRTALASALVLLAAGAVHAAPAVHTEVVAKGLDHPWALTFIGGGRMLITERAGKMRVIQPDGAVSAPLKGLPAIFVGGQGGLLDVVADSDFARNRTIYFCYAEPAKSGGGNSTALAVARLSADDKTLENVKVIFSQRPKVESSLHFGCRIVEAKDGTLFLTLGERFMRMQDAQKLDNHLGKVVRINKDGSAPRDNPFIGKDGALPDIWSYGHRNSQGATLGPDGRLWMHEHGPKGGDEVNRPQPGRNYGWPLVSYGVHYDGSKVGDGVPTKAGIEAPLYQWTPSIAPSGMSFLYSDRYGKEWQGSLFVGALKFKYLARLEVRDGKITGEEKLLEDLDQRIRDVREGPDGLLYLLTDESRGELIRVVPGK